MWAWWRQGGHPTVGVIRLALEFSSVRSVSLGSLCAAPSSLLWSFKDLHPEAWLSAAGSHHIPPRRRSSSSQLSVLLTQVSGGPRDPFDFLPQNKHAGLFRIPTCAFPSEWGTHTRCFFARALERFSDFQLNFLLSMYGCQSYQSVASLSLADMGTGMASKSLCLRQEVACRL